MSNIEKTLQERGNRYGPFQGHASTTQGMKKVFYDRIEQNPLYEAMTTAQKDVLREACDMIFHKLGRVANGDPLYADNPHDIVGYAKLWEASLIEGLTPPPLSGMVGSQVNHGDKE